MTKIKDYDWRWFGLILIPVALVISFLISPFSFDDKIHTRRVANADSLFLALMVDHGVERLTSDPFNYYSAPFLYPDPLPMRLSSTYLTHSLIAIPFKGLAHGNPYILGEISRYLAVLISFFASFVLFQELGLKRFPALLATCSVLLIALNAASIERFQSLSFGWLALSIITLMEIIRHEEVPLYQYLILGMSLFLLVHASVYMVVALLAISPVFLAAIINIHKVPRVKAKLLPLGITIGLTLTATALSLFPWLSNRWDLGVFASEDFVAVKRWYETKVHQFFASLPEFADSFLSPAPLQNGAFPGWGFVCLVVLVVGFSIWWLCKNDNWKKKVQLTGHIRNALLVVWLIVYALCYFLAEGGFQFYILVDVFLAGLILSWMLKICLQFWKGKSTEDFYSAVASMFVLVGFLLVLFSLGGDQLSVKGACISKGVFGFSSLILPPVNQFRFLYRMTSLGGWFMGIGLLTRLNLQLRGWKADREIALFGLVALVSVLPWLQMQYSFVEFEEMPEIYRSLEKSEKRGGLLELPMTIWTDPLAMNRMQWQRQHGRKIVDGVNSTAPPWYPIASEVFNSFTSLECRKLMAAWKIETVVIDSDKFEIQREDLVKFPELKLLKENDNYLLYDYFGVEEYGGRQILSKITIRGEKHPAMMDDPIMGKLLSDGNSFYDNAPELSREDRLIFTLAEGESLEGVELIYGFGIGLKIPERIWIEAEIAGVWQDVTKGQTGRFLRARAANLLLHQKFADLCVGVSEARAKRFRIRSSRAKWHLPELRLILK